MDQVNQPDQVEMSRKDVFDDHDLLSCVVFLVISDFSQIFLNKLLTELRTLLFNPLESIPERCFEFLKCFIRSPVGNQTLALSLDMVHQSDIVVPFTDLVFIFLG